MIAPTADNMLGDRALHQHTSTWDFHTTPTRLHHAAAISAAIVTADAAAITVATNAHAARLDAGQGG